MNCGATSQPNKPDQPAFAIEQAITPRAEASGGFTHSDGVSDRDSFLVRGLSTNTGFKGVGKPTKVASAWALYMQAGPAGHR